MDLEENDYCAIRFNSSLNDSICHAGDHKRQDPSEACFCRSDGETQKKILRQLFQDSIEP